MLGSEETVFRARELLRREPVAAAGWSRKGFGSLHPQDRISNVDSIEDHSERNANFGHSAG